MVNWLAIGLGGFVGAISRYWVSGLAQKMGDRFPWGTLTVNLVGSLLMGFLAVLFLEKMMVSQELRLFLLVGVLGAFTTYSTFSLETMNLLRSAEWGLAAFNLGANALGTVFAVWIGASIAKFL